MKKIQIMFRKIVIIRRDRELNRGNVREKRKNIQNIRININLIEEDGLHL